MNLSCDIVMDLIALYHDRLASEASVKAIEAHLKKCSSCRKSYKNYKIADIQATNSEELTTEEVQEEFEKIAKRLRKRQYIWTSGVGSYVIFSLGLLFFIWWRNHVESNRTKA